MFSRYDGLGYKLSNIWLLTTKFVRFGFGRRSWILAKTTIPTLTITSTSQKHHHLTPSMRRSECVLYVCRRPASSSPHCRRSASERNRITHIHTHHTQLRSKDVCVRKMYEAHVYRRFTRKALARGALRYVLCNECLQIRWRAVQYKKRCSPGFWSVG